MTACSELGLHLTANLHRESLVDRRFCGHDVRLGSSFWEVLRKTNMFAKHHLHYHEVIMFALRCNVFPGVLLGIFFLASRATDLDRLALHDPLTLT